MLRRHDGERVRRMLARHVAPLRCPRCAGQPLPNRPLPASLCGLDAHLVDLLLDGEQ